MTKRIKVHSSTVRDYTNPMLTQILTPAVSIDTSRYSPELILFRGSLNGIYSIILANHSEISIHSLTQQIFIERLMICKVLLI